MFLRTPVSKLTNIQPHKLDALTTLRGFNPFFCMYATVVGQKSPECWRSVVHEVENVDVRLQQMDYARFCHRFTGPLWIQRGARFKALYPTCGHRTGNGQ